MTVVKEVVVVVVVVIVVLLVVAVMDREGSDVCGGGRHRETETGNSTQRDRDRQ